MLPIFSFLQFLVRRREVVVDNAVFQLHYRWTVGFLLAFSVLVTLKQYWGEAILCQPDIDDKKKLQTMTTFCWVEVTYTIPSAYNLTVGEEVPYPGIINSAGKEKKYHAFYQWVGLTLFFQAVLFCIPRYIWKSEEGGLVKHLVFGLNNVIQKEENDANVARLVTYLNASHSTHGVYVAKYLICEIINFVSVVLQLVLTERFLGGDLSSHALEMLGLREDPYGVSSPLYEGYRVFPKMTKCAFHDYGPGGSVNKKDLFCLLPLNVIHQKIYVFIFVWFVILAVASGLVIVLRVVSFLVLEYREKALATHATLCPNSIIRKVCQKCTFSDWFFLKLVCKNVSSQHSRKVLYGVADDKELPASKRRGREESTIESSSF